MTDKEKLEKAVKLADAMYYAAQCLTTDASRLHKAMDEYHQFIITEYNKQEPASEDIEQELESFIKSGKAKKEENCGNFITTHIDLLKIAKHFAQWQEKKDIVDSFKSDMTMPNKFFEAGAKWQREQTMAKTIDGEVGYWNIRGLSINMELPKNLKEGDKVKVVLSKDK